MGKIAMALPPPRLWQQFEELTKDAVQHIYNDRTATAYGNQGAPQHGVDVYARQDERGKRIAVQCKRLGKTDTQGRMLPGGLKPGHLATEIVKAKKFPNGLDHFILATTDTRRVAIQNEERRLNDEQIAAGSFTIQVWFWDDYLSFLHKYAPLLQWYYEHILELKGVYSADHQILYLFHMAFSRPAFTTKLASEESGSGLFDALQDTETAINVGQLKDRLTKGLLRVAPGGAGMLTKVSWQAEIAKALLKVQEARALYKKARDVDKAIIENPRGVGVTDWNVAQRLDDLRGDAIRILNKVLFESGLPEIVSPL